MRPRHSCAGSPMTEAYAMLSASGAERWRNRDWAPNRLPLLCAPWGFTFHRERIGLAMGKTRRRTTHRDGTGRSDEPGARRAWPIIAFGSRRNPQGSVATAL